jgi:uncharacterized phiE125 gp8 family phage protein
MRPRQSLPWRGRYISKDYFMAIALITPPAVLPVTLAQIKTFLKIEHADDDALISDLIAQAVTHIETIANRRCITQTWRMYFDDLSECGILELDLAPISAIAELRYFDADGNAIVIATNDYEQDTYSNPARIHFNKSFNPGQHLNGLEVDMQLGFGLSGIDVPGDILRAIMVTIAHWYEFRGAVHPADQPLSNPTGLNALLAPYRKVNL